MKNGNTKKWQKILDRIKTEGFSLFQSTTNPNLYEVSYKKSPDKFVRLRMNCENLESAIQQAKIKIGILPFEKPKIHIITLADAFNMTLRESKRTSDKDWKTWVTKFIKWLIDNYPDCTHWHLLSRDILRSYLHTLSGRANNTIRLYMQPIVQTSGFMSREYSLPNIAEKLSFSKEAMKATPKVYLIDVIEFLDFVRDNFPYLEAGIALQSLAGLRIKEVLRLTWDKIDFKNGLVEISGIFKTKYSERVIPLCSRILEILKRTHNQRVQSGKVIDIHEPVIAQQNVGFFSEKNWEVYTRKVRLALRVWNAKIDWAPKDLRNCLFTFAAISGILNDIWEQYLGHAPKSISGRHYIPRLNSVTTGEKQALLNQMEIFRVHVIEQIEKAITGLNEKTNQRIEDSIICISNR